MTNRATLARLLWIAVTAAILLLYVIPIAADDLVRATGRAVAAIGIWTAVYLPLGRLIRGKDPK